MTTQVTVREAMVSYSPNTRVRIIAGSHSGKQGVVGSAKPNNRNEGKTEVLVGRQNKSVWCKPEWLELQELEKICSPNLTSAQELGLDSPAQTAVEIQEVFDQISAEGIQASNVSGIETGSGRQCNQDRKESSGNALGVCQIDSQPSTYAVESGQGSHSECLSPVDSNSSDSVKLMTSAAISYETDSQESRSIQMCDHSDPKEASASLPVPRLVNHSQLMESAREPLIKETAFQTCCELSSRSCLDSSPSKTSQEFSVAPSLQNSQSQGDTLDSRSGTFPAAGTMRSGLVSGAETLALPSLEEGCCWLASPGALSSATSRIPGLCKSESEWQKLGLLKKGEVANPDFLENCFGLPKGWTSPQESRPATELLGQEEKSSEIRSIIESRRSPSPESSISTLCCEDFPKSIGKTWIDPKEVELYAGTQSRDRTDWETVERYIEQMTEGLWDWEREPLPVVFQDLEGRKYPGDAHHRTTAAVAAKVDLICVDLRSGSLIDAIMFSCEAKANREHGLPLTAKDQRRRIELFLETRDHLPEGDERRCYSSREIARYLALSESGYRTIVNIINEREMLGKISQFTPGDRIQVVQNTATGSNDYWPEGTLGKIQSLDKKKGVFVIPDRSSNRDGCMLPSGWVHPDSLVKSDIPEPKEPVKTFHDQEAESEVDWQVDDLCQYRETIGQITRIEGDDVWVSLNGYLETVPIFEIKRTAPDHNSVLPPQSLVGGEPKSSYKQLLPSIKPNGDTPSGIERPTPAALVNGSAITRGKPDVIATEIAIGIRHLSVSQLAWVLTSAANNGLSDDHLKAVVKTAKEILNLRHHPEYFAIKHKNAQRVESMLEPSTSVQVIDPDESAELDMYCLNDEDLTLGVGDEGEGLDESDLWLEQAS